MKQTKRQNNIIVCILFIINMVSCERPAVNNDSKTDCDKCVAAKNGFYVDIYLKNISERKILFKIGEKEFFPQVKKKDDRKASFLILEKIKLSDTLECILDSRSFKIYNFRNITEEAVDSRNHKKIEICRISTAKIDGRIIHDSNNNVLKVVLK